MTTRDDLVTAADAARAVVDREWKAGRGILAVYATYLAACRALDAYDKDHPMTATPEPLPSQRPEPAQSVPEEADGVMYPRRRKGDRPHD